MTELGSAIAGLGTIGFFLFWMFDGWDRVRRRFDDDFRRKWLKRVRNRLYQNGSALTHDFANLPVKTSEINWAIELYFDKYEFEQELIFAQRKMENLIETKIINEVRFKHISSRLLDKGTS